MCCATAAHSICTKVKYGHDDHRVPQRNAAAACARLVGAFFGGAGCQRLHRHSPRLARPVTSSLEHCFPEAHAQWRTSFTPLGCPHSVTIVLTCERARARADARRRRRAARRASTGFTYADRSACRRAQLFCGPYAAVCTPSAVLRRVQDIAPPESSDTRACSTMRSSALPMRSCSLNAALGAW